MTLFPHGYVLAWSAFCLVAVGIASRRVELRWREVVAFLGVPWKLALFVPAILCVTFAGRFTDDETWDVVNGAMMSILTFLTSWWSVGAAAKIVRRQLPPILLVVVVAVTLFSSSWCYDAWLFIRDGRYSDRWLGNLLLSPTIYLCAGLVLNLEMRDGKLAFAFGRSDWPRPVATGLKWPIVLVALPLVAIAVWFLVGFVGWHF